MADAEFTKEELAALEKIKSDPDYWEADIWNAPNGDDCLFLDPVTREYCGGKPAGVIYLTGTNSTDAPNVFYCDRHLIALYTDTVKG